MTAEMSQFAALIAGFIVVAVLWVFIIYLPARTMEHSESRRAKNRGRDGGVHGGSG